MSSQKQENVAWKYLTVDDFFSDPEPDTSFDDARRVFLEEQEEKRRSGEDSDLTAARNWSFLSSKVIGAEE